MFSSMKKSLRSEFTLKQISQEQSNNNINVKYESKGGGLYRFMDTTHQ